MGVQIKPSDLYFRYRRKKDLRDQPKFSGKPDANPFDRNDLYEVIPMFEAVMDALGSNDQRVLERLEEIAGDEMPSFIQTREEETRVGVPLLKDIPLVGWLFGRNTTIERRSELVIFITPTIIAGHAAAAP